jgi:transcription termination factor Rho
VTSGYGQSSSYGRGGFRRSFGGPRRDYGENRQTNDLEAGVPTMELSGILEVQPEGHGYLRPKFVPSERDVYVSSSQIRRFGIRAGDMVSGIGREPKESERYYGLLRVDKINGEEVPQTDPAQIPVRPWFDDLTPIYPDTQLKLETEPEILSTRIIDLIAPIGRGQRGLIVSPPKAGKTWLLKEIANAISANYPDYHLIVTLVGERPEEVTDIARNTKAEVIASNFDDSPTAQIRAAEISIERARRLVEKGGNVVMLLDSITRLARAYNLAMPNSGRTLSGGFDPQALFPAKKFLGAARCIEGGGSLTIIGTALINTDSRMDDLIYEEFKGTGNMELHLDRRLAERRIYPAVDVAKSGTRNDERFFTTEQMEQRKFLVRGLDLLNDEERTEMLMAKLSKAKTNAEFLKNLKTSG